MEEDDSAVYRDEREWHATEPFKTSVAAAARAMFLLACGQFSKVRSGQNGPSPWELGSFEGQLEIEVSHSSGIRAPPL